MKPISLKCPFDWKNRQVMICDRVWYIPGHFHDFAHFTFPGWKDPSLFENTQPICIEYCSGNGAWIAEKARTHSNYNWVAIEKKFPRVRKIWAKIKNLNLTNLIVASAEGYALTREYIPSSSVAKVYINFPDPWPKARHNKHRIVQIPFIQEVERILELNGELTIVTDDADYSQWIIEVLQHVPEFVSIFGDRYFVEEYPDYGTSYFEDLWREKGKTIKYHVYKKVSSSNRTEEKAV